MFPKWNWYFPKISLAAIIFHHEGAYGSFSPGRGKWAKSVIFFYFWSFTVTKRFDFFKFSQLFWRDYVRCSLKILSFTPQKNFGVPCSTPVFALLSDFWVKIRALVRPNRQRWTGFDLLIIFLVKFWWFSFFWNLSSPSGRRVSPV